MAVPKIKDSRTYLDLRTVNSPISNPYVDSIAHDDNLDFSPRVGFAWDVSGKGNHVLRGGYGLYYGNVFQNIPLFMEQMANPTVFQTVLSLSSPTDPYRARERRWDSGSMASTRCRPFLRPRTSWHLGVSVG